MKCKRRRVSAAKSVLIAFLFLLYGDALGQSVDKEEKEPVAVIEIGGLLFKKPWTLSKKVEFMVGVGPQWVHTNEHGKSPNSVSCEAVVDVMFWRSKKHRFSWCVEPDYEYNFGRGHEQSVGVIGGLLIAFG